MEEYGTMVSEHDGPRGLAGVTFTARTLEAHREGMGRSERTLSRRILTLNTTPAMPVIWAEERPQGMCAGPSLESIRRQGRYGEDNADDRERAKFLWAMPWFPCALWSATAKYQLTLPSAGAKSRRRDKRIRARFATLRQAAFNKATHLGASPSQKDSPRAPLARGHGAVVNPDTDAHHTQAVTGIGFLHRCSRLRPQRRAGLVSANHGAQHHR